MEVPTLFQKEVLAELGIMYKTLRRYEESGKIRVVRISRRIVRYFPSDIEKLKLEIKEVK